MLNRAWRHASLDAGVTRTVLDPAGGSVETRDGKGAITLTGYDTGHRPTRLWAADRPGQAPTLRQVTVYGDQPGAGLTPAGAAAGNLMGRPYGSYDEAGLVTTPGYDLDGNLLTKTRRTLRADLLLSGTPAGPGSWDGTAYSVDWQPGPGQTLDQHAAALLEAAGYQTDEAYDALHRVTTLTGPADVTGARTTLTHTYTPAGQLTSVTADGTPQLAQAIYNARGQRSLAILGSGTLIRYLHDPATFRLTRLRAEPIGTPAGQVTWTGTSNPQDVLQDYGYDYDLAGNLLTLRDRTPGSGLPIGADPARSPSPDGLDRTFGYDPLYRLHDATGRETALPPNPPWIDTPAGTDITKAQPYTETYDYDLAGNLLTLRHASNTGYTRTCTPAAESNRIATLTIKGGWLAYTHDPAGNLTREADVRRFEWDHANRLATFRTQTDGAVPSIYAQYRYDAVGTRVLKIVQRGGSAPDITVCVGGLFERLIVSDGAQAATAYDTIHILDDHNRISVLRRGAPLPGDPYPDATYHLGDHLTSSTAVLSPAGQLLNHEEYTPYGETSLGSYNRKRYRYTAKERDEETGLTYHGARYYAPWLARWTSSDPALPRDGTCAYSYAAGSPLRFIDANGAAPTPASALVESEPLLEQAGSAAPRVALKVLEGGRAMAAAPSAGMLLLRLGIYVIAAGAFTWGSYELYKAYSASKEVRQSAAEIAQEREHLAQWKPHTPPETRLSSGRRGDEEDRRAFRRMVKETINRGCPEQGLSEHPLKVALERVKWDASHTTAAFIFGGMELAVELEKTNSDSSKVRSGLDKPKSVIYVCHVPIVKDSAVWLEIHGLLDPWEVYGKEPSTGWIPGQKEHLLSGAATLSSTGLSLDPPRK